MNTNLNHNEYIDQHPSTVDLSQLIKEKLEEQYGNLINCVQIHSCRPNGYCKSKKANKKGECSFEFPFALQIKTELVFVENDTSVCAEIRLKRNDGNLNQHNKLICLNWGGNVDMQIILDKNAAIRYMVKYAAKP